MPDSGLDPQAHFIKQRRNLVITSLVLIFYHAAGLKFTDLDILGNKTTVDHPQVMTVALDIFFFYFLWRYYAACNEILGVSKFVTAYQARLRNLTRKLAGYRVAKKAKLVSDQDFFLDQIEKYLANGKSDPENKYTYRLGSSKTNIPAESKEILSSIGIIKIEGLQRILLRLYALITCVLKEKPFGEYILPYILATFAGVELLGFNVTERLLEKLIHL